MESATSYSCEKEASCQELSRSRSRSISMAWILAMEEQTEEGGDGMKQPPPDCIVLHADLVQRGWGWERLVPFSLGSVDWPDFKKYFVNYYQNNGKKVSKLISKQKPDGQPEKVAAEHDDLLGAVNMCIKAENMIIKSCLHYFTLEDFVLSSDILERVKQLLKSGCESSAAAAALLCITNEDELVCELSRRHCEVFEALTFANVVRRAASKFLLFEGSEHDSAAAAGVMLGMAREAESIVGSLKGEHSDAFMEYLTAENIRQRAVKALTKLEKELFCKTADTDGDGTHTDAARDLNSDGNSVRKNKTILPEESNSSEGMRNKNPNNWVEAGDVGTELYELKMHLKEL